jgi:O-antigen ligase
VSLAKAWPAAVGIAAFAAVLAVSARPLLGLALILTCLLVVFTLAKPEAATLLVVFLVYTDTPSVLVQKGLPQAFSGVVPLLLVLPLAAGLLRRGRLVIDPVFLLLVAYLVVELLAATQAIDGPAAVVRIQTFALEGLISYFLLINVIRTPEMVRRVVWTLVAGAAFLGGLTLLQDVTHTYYRSYFGFAQVSQDFYYGLVDKPRFQGPIGDPNYFAQVLLLAIPFALLFVAKLRGGVARTAALVSAVCISGGIVLTYSRGAVLAFCAVIVLMVLLGNVRLRYAALLAGLVALAIIAVPTYRERVASLSSVSSSAGAQVGSSDTVDLSVQERSTEMQAALLVAENHPLLGVGPGQFPLYYQRYAAHTGGEVHQAIKFGPEKGTTPQRVTHNLFLGIIANLGVVGLAVFFAIIGATLRLLWRARRRLKQFGDHSDLGLIVSGCLLALVAYLIAGAFLELAYERYLWLLLAVSAAAARVVLRQPPSEGEA